MEKLIQLLIFLNFAVSNTAYGKSGEMFIFVLRLRFSAYPFVKSSQTFMDYEINRSDSFDGQIFIKSMDYRNSELKHNYVILSIINTQDISFYQDIMLPTVYSVIEARRASISSFYHSRYSFSLNMLSQLEHKLVFIMLM